MYLKKPQSYTVVKLFTVPTKQSVDFRKFTLMLMVYFPLYTIAYFIYLFIHYNYCYGNILTYFYFFGW